MATRQRSSSKKKGRKAMQGRRSAKKSENKEPMQDEFPSEMPEKAELEG